MIWLSTLLPTAATLFASKPWQNKPENDSAPTTQGADPTTLILVGVFAVTAIVLLIVFLNKKK